MSKTINYEGILSYVDKDGVVHQLFPRVRTDKALVEAGIPADAAAVGKAINATNKAISDNYNEIKNELSDVKNDLSDVKNSVTYTWNPDSAELHITLAK